MVERIGKPVGIRHGPAAVTGELPPTRASAATGRTWLGRRAVRRRSGSPKTGLALGRPGPPGQDAAGPTRRRACRGGRPSQNIPFGLAELSGIYVRPIFLGTTDRERMRWAGLMEGLNVWLDETHTPHQPPAAFKAKYDALRTPSGKRTAKK